MLRIFQITFILLLLQSCTQPTPQKSKRVSSFDDVEETPKGISLFHNQQDKLERVNFKNERKKDPEIDALLKTVEKAIDQKNLALLFTVMGKNVISSHGGGMYGFEDFKNTWEDDYQALWDKLNKILSIGGYFVDDTTYRIPFDGNVDEKAGRIDDNVVPYGCGITTKENTKLYPTPNFVESEGAVIGSVYTMVDLFPGFYGGGNEIWKVNIIGTGIHGYVKAEDYYCSADYCLIIEKNKQGTWKITSFAPWD